MMPDRPEKVCLKNKAKIVQWHVMEVPMQTHRGAERVKGM